MSDVPSEDEIFEMEKNLIRELAADDELDRLLAILEEDELEASQSSSRNVRRRKYRDREREKGHDRLVCDYFTENPTFGAEIFRRRFRMRRKLFLRIVSYCPVAWKGQYTRGDYGVPTIILEAVASADLWIWHAFFGCACSNNDINVLNRSPLFNAVLQGNAPQVTFTVNGTTYRNEYYLTDGIYPEWASFVKSFPCPMDPKHKKFKERQEAARKDV